MTKARDENAPKVNARLIEASLLAGALGDSLGAEIEFLSLSEILRKFPNGFDDLPAHQGMVGAITDDTQMTLFTAEGLINAFVRQSFKGICHPPSVVHHALLRWLITQGYQPKMHVDHSGLVEEQRLHHQRAPGNTCLSALSEAARFGDVAQNNSKGCGTIMRVAPVAFIQAKSTRDLALETSALTHGHATGQKAAAAWALMLEDVYQGVSLEAAARARMPEFEGETKSAIQQALEAPRDGLPETVEALGGGWIAEEALSIALYACLAATDLEGGLRIAVTHSGDSDSTGAIAGNMLGLMFPDEVFSHRWSDQVECRDLIERLASDLALCVSGHVEEVSERYPGA